ncbi:uncharacterized protein LOC122093350 [Macadamia integrifolia]|uniref:uncharacterized protein LOC122093350 n=1 Tax=Macadamia integrifolia TaxID=60698 RepID=UPI001C52FBB6|nr:uncharacterized protein LOC122093350 [Macadamia integrifolia]
MPPPAALMGTTTMREPVRRRRNSIASSVIPAKLNLSSDETLNFPIVNGGSKVSHAVDDLELISLRTRTNYTSLKDLLPSSPAAGIQSPRAVPGVESGYEICIRNRLVKQAAWAYLQPKSVTPGSSGRHFFQRIWDRFQFLREYLRNSVNACFEFLNQYVVSKIARVFDRLLGLIWVGRNKER